jgi:hypothetical protein
MMPDDTVLDMPLDERCAVVAVSHEFKLDDLALMQALRVPILCRRTGLATNKPRDVSVSGSSISTKACLAGCVVRPVSSIYIASQ